MNKLKIHFLNTVWSDAIILESSNHFALVDTASKFYYPMIVDYFNTNNIEELDFILLTHFHSDHYGNLKSIITDYKVNTLYLKQYCAKESDIGGGFKTNEEYLEHEKMMYEDIIKTAQEKKINIVYLDSEKKNLTDSYNISFNGNILELYNTNNNIMDIYNDSNSPFYNIHTFSENSNSIALFTMVNNHTILLGADLTDNPSVCESVSNLASKLVKYLLDKYNLNNIDVYKSCHHGGGGTNKLSLISLIKPKYAIITNTDSFLDKWETIPNMKIANSDVTICKTDKQQFIFDFSNKDITYNTIDLISLFLTLNKK